MGNFTRTADLYSWEISYVIFSIAQDYQVDDFAFANDYCRRWQRTLFKGIWRQREFGKAYSAKLMTPKRFEDGAYKHVRYETLSDWFDYCQWDN